MSPSAVPAVGGFVTVNMVYLPPELLWLGNQMVRSIPFGENRELKILRQGRLRVRDFLNAYTLFYGLAYNKCRYFAMYVVFFRASQGRGKIRALSKISPRIILGDPGADSGDEEKSKRAEKYIWNEEK